MSPDDLKQYLKVLREGNVMSANLKFPDGFALAVVMGPDPMPEAQSENPAPGGWKTDVQDPDPLGLGALDAEFAMDPLPVPEVE
jgi:hypothetical protein